MFKFFNNEGIILRPEFKSYDDLIKITKIQFALKNFEIDPFEKIVNNMKDLEKRIKHEKFISDINQEFSERYEKQFPWNQPIKRFLSLVR